MKKTNSYVDKNRIRKSADDLIYLLSCAFNEGIPSIERCREMNLADVYNIASMHFLASAAAFALEQVMKLPREFDQAKKKAIRKLSLFEIERSAVLGEFEKAGIWYLPLKGIVLGKYYPKTAMREMSDNDIFCDPERIDDVIPIMKRRGYSFERLYDSYEDVYEKPPTMVFEIHRTLFNEKKTVLLYEYYKDIEDRLVRESEFGRKLTDEDFYIYLIAHMYKHYSNRGTGLRSLADTFVFLNKFADVLDREYVDAELEKLELSDFERKVSSLSRKVFTNTPLTEKEEKTLDHFIFSSVYGDPETAETNKYLRAMNHDVSDKSKKKYFRSRVFISGEKLKQNYPFVNKHRVLYPALVVYRPIKGLIMRPKSIFGEYRKVKKLKKED